MITDHDQARLEALFAQNASALARLNAHLQAMIPIYIEETALSSEVAEATSASLQIEPTRDTFFRCTGIFVSVPLGTTAAELQLGNQFKIPLQNTTTLLTPVQRILRSTDLRELTFTTGADNGGVAFVWLFGDAVPANGMM